MARSLPSVSADGKTYTFRIRAGYRFSPPSNAPVSAETFKDTIERTLNPRMNSPTADYLADIVGAGAYMAGKAGHIAGLSATGDTLTIHLLHPDPDFRARIALPSFCAVPSGTPIDRKGLPTIPSAGPYYVASYTPGQGVVLERGPNYHGSRPRQFARIELAVRISDQRAVADVEAGHADYTPFESTQANAGAISAQLAARYGSGIRPQQYFVTPLLQLDYFILNTHRPLFADARMRQAVNFVIDRRALAALGDTFQALPERAADHYLPPSMPRLRDAQVYPSSPDVGRARQLADRSDTTAVLFTCNSAPCPEQAQILRTDLAAIGLRLQVKTFPAPTLFSLLSKPNQPLDLAYNGWPADYPDPSAMLNPLLSESAVESTFADPTYHRELAEAGQLSSPAGYLAYGRLDVDLAGNARRWSLSAASRVMTSSPHGSAARPMAYTAWTSQRCARGGRTDRAQSFVLVPPPRGSPASVVASASRGPARRVVRATR